ncbi:unnamed protein product [Linum trigynum]|uniref:Uncharacterized protein n=1 Tax=Linum trigynum TaxID=586398 RepID=A0AAV2CTB6_9ROSI
MVLNNPQLHPAVTFSNKVFRKDKEFSRYVRRFRDRAIYPSFTIQPSAFSMYDMDISALIRNLGWESLFEDQRFTYCPEAVRLFYVNLKRGSGPDLYSFKTTVGNLEITVTADLLASELGLPHNGLKAGDDGQFHDYNFDYHHVHNSLPISYASMVFCHLVKYGDDNYDGWLPLAPLITQLLRKLGVDLRDKVTLWNVHDDLKTQHVLARLDASVGPRKPVTGSGGEVAALVKALVSAAEVVVDHELTGFSSENLKGKRKIPVTTLTSMSTRLKLLRDGGGESSSSIREEDEAVEELEEFGDISYYDSPPHYPF